LEFSVDVFGDGVRAESSGGERYREANFGEELIASARPEQLACHERGGVIYRR